MDVRGNLSNEKRLIDANAMRDDWLENGENEYVYDTNAVLDSIDSQPTVDAVEVVRCRDCKHCDPENYHCDHHMGTSAPLRRKPDDFCSYGEQKDGDGNG